MIPDCGVAPGLSNILVGRAVSSLDEVEEVRVLVGGLPEDPVPPIGYTVTWCVEDLLSEYVRDSSIVKNGRVVKVKPLGGLEEVVFPELGRLEAFYTDGVRTLHHTVQGVQNMWEKTLRYPGHAKKLKMLRTLGFLDEKPVKLEDKSIVPRRFTAALLRRRLSMPGVKDVVAMRVEVIGYCKGERIRHIYHLLDRYDEQRRITAMARTTAYTASTITQLLAQGEIQGEGVIPPERLGMDEDVFHFFMAEMKGKGINISHQHKSLK